VTAGLANARNTAKVLLLAYLARLPEIKYGLVLFEKGLLWR